MTDLAPEGNMSLVHCSHCGHPECSVLDIANNPEILCSVCGKVLYKTRDNMSTATKPMGGMATACGCGRHQVNLVDKDVVRYHDTWWRLGCLFMKVDRRMPKIIRKFEEMEKEVARCRKLRIKFIKMKNYMRQQPCDNCGLQVGNRFVQSGNSLYCGRCRHLAGDIQ